MQIHELLRDGEAEARPAELPRGRTGSTKPSRRRKGCIERENQTLATITFQNLFRMYEKLAGMTGTADTEAAELAKIYKLDVVVAPTNLVVEYLFKIQVSREVVEPAAPRPTRPTPARSEVTLSHGPVERRPTAARSAQKVGRNGPCPCGSGKKYKKCCLAKGA